MRGVLLLLLCAGCCDPPPPLQIPPELADCQSGPVAPTVPAPPRTLNVVVAFANENAAALGRTQSVLAACRAKLREVVRLAQEHR